MRNSSGNETAWSYQHYIVKQASIIIWLFEKQIIFHQAGPFEYVGLGFFVQF